MVAGGLPEMSQTTREMPFTSLTMKSPPRASPIAAGTAFADGAWTPGTVPSRATAGACHRQCGQQEPCAAHPTPPTAGKKLRPLLPVREYPRDHELLVLGDQQIAWRLQWVETLAQRADKQ